jgi:hypothetical protein
MFYWGESGLKRNIEAGTQFLKMGAQNNDPTSLFGYGLSLLKVNKY